MKWDKILNDVNHTAVLRGFVMGYYTRRDVEYAGEPLRSFVRERGAKNARQVARKALERRNLV